MVEKVEVKNIDENLLKKDRKEYFLRNANENSSGVKIIVEDGVAKIIEDNQPDELIIDNINLHAKDENNFENNYDISFSCKDNENKSKLIESKNLMLADVKKLIEDLAENKYQVGFSVNDKQVYTPVKKSENLKKEQSKKDENTSQKVLNSENLNLAKEQKVENVVNANDVGSQQIKQTKKNSNGDGNIVSAPVMMQSQVSAQKGEKTEEKPKEKDLKVEDKKISPPPKEKKEEPPKKEVKSAWKNGLKDLTRVAIKAVSMFFLCAVFFGVFSAALSGIIFVVALLANFATDKVISLGEKAVAKTIQVYKKCIGIKSKIKSAYKFCKEQLNEKRMNKKNSKKLATDEQIQQNNVVEDVAEVKSLNEIFPEIAEIDKKINVSDEKCNACQDAQNYEQKSSKDIVENSNIKEKIGDENAVKSLSQTKLTKKLPLKTKVKLFDNSNNFPTPSM